MNKELFEKGLKSLNIEADESKTEKFGLYSDLLVEWNKKMNLTAITEKDEITVKHFLDSLLILNAVSIDQKANVIDVGTGAGFPGVPLKIVRDDISLTLMDSLQKRIRFLEAVGEKLSLTDIKYIHSRAEDGGRDKLYREKYDVAVSRAVADMEVLCEYCLPFVKVGGIFAALKAYGSNDETERAKPMIGNLGGEVEEIKNIKLPCSDITRSFVIVRKKKSTPPSFPRSANRIKKKTK